MGKIFDFAHQELLYLEELHDGHEAALSPYAARDAQAKRERASDYTDPVRSKFAVDIDRILHNAMFNRGADKTQVFSFFRNDDVTRRASHVQLVSRIARIIGKALKLNLDLIEAIAIGHDIGHTPFGHKGEAFLNELSLQNTGRYFNHNVHSVRILQCITGSNLTLQTLDGILCHNGEKASVKYEPAPLRSFDEFYGLMEQYYCTAPKDMPLPRPCTLEGCVVRISDIIAYLGKDRQDAQKIRLPITDYAPNAIGASNKDIITHLIHHIIQRSVGKGFISMDETVLTDIEAMRRENHTQIYQRPEITAAYDTAVKPMMGRLYAAFKQDYIDKAYTSPLFKHYLNNPVVSKFYQPKAENRRLVRDADEVVTDYIASMTDDYFIDVFRYIFPEDPLNDAVAYVGYFDDRYMR